MAVAAVSQRTRVTLNSDRSAGTPLHTDKEIAEAAASEVATFLLDNDLELGYSRTELENLRIRPLTRDEVSFAIRLIDKGGHPFVLEIDRNANMNESGRYSITMKREFTINELNEIGIVVDDVAALGISGSEVKIKLITVANTSFAAMKRHRDSLARRAKTTDYLFLRMPERQYLIPREKSCCEKISDCVSSFIPTNCCQFMCCLTCWAIIGGSIYGAIQLASD